MKPRPFWVWPTWERTQDYLLVWAGPIWFQITHRGMPLISWWAWNLYYGWNRD